MEVTKLLKLFVHQGSFKKCSRLFSQAKTFRVVVWAIAFIIHLHVWVEEPKPSLTFLQLPVLTSNNVVWVRFLAVLFDETQHVVKISRMRHMPVYYEISNMLLFLLQGLPMLFIESQNLVLMGLTFFFICKLKRLKAVCEVFNFIACNFHHLSVSCCSISRNNTLEQCFLNPFALGCWIENKSSYIPPSLM